MTQQSLKYPNRADMLTLLKAREKNPTGPAAPRLSSVTAASRTDAPVCFNFAIGTAR